METRWTDDERRLRRRIFWVALIVRLLYMTLAHTYRVRTSEFDHFGFGWEMGRIARALATGFGYADPFNGHTGPTAWSPPMYTLLMAGIFKICGVYSNLSAWCILACNCLMSASTAVAIWEIAYRMIGKKCALWSGWMWALFPAAMQYAVRWLWEMTETTWIFTWILVLALRMRTDQEGQSWRRWLFFGFLWGALCLSSPTPAILLPFVGLWLIFAPKFKAVRMAQAVAAAIVFCAVLSPWAIRNWVVFHKFIPLRGNFGAENYKGNNDTSDGFPWGTAIPLADKVATHDYISLGEVGFVADRGAQADQWIRTHHTRYMELNAKRAYMFWFNVPHPLETGFNNAVTEYVRDISFQFISLAGWFGLFLALRRRILFSGVALAAFAFFPITYYLVTVQARFRHPLEPFICIFGVFLFQSAEPGTFGRWVAARFAWLGRMTTPLRPFFRGESNA